MSCNDDISVIESKKLDCVRRTSFEIGTTYKTIFESFSKDLSTLERRRILEIAKEIGETYCREHEKMEQVLQEADFLKIPPEVNSKIFEINTQYSLYVMNTLLKLKSYDLKKFDLDEFQEQTEKEYIDIKRSLYFYVTNFLEGFITKRDFNFSETFRRFNEVFYDGSKLRDFQTMGDIVFAFLEGQKIVFTDSEEIFLGLIERTITDFQTHLSQLKSLKEFSDFVPAVEQIYENAFQTYSFLLENRSDDPRVNYEGAKRFYEGLSGVRSFFGIVEDNYDQSYIEASNGRSLLQASFKSPLEKKPE